MSPSSSTTNAIGDTVSNGLEAYEILERLVNGKTSTIYRVLCKSGRLRGRQLAMKKTPTITTSTTAKPRYISPFPLHQALHHPNIVSLLSAFTTSQETFHVLELCSIGNLADFLSSRPSQALLESEIRAVTKSLADALMYLRKELIIHRDINPSNVLLTNNYGVKLSDFKLSVRLPAADSTASSFCGSPNYAAPEMSSGVPYSFPVDIWSLGCVIFACLSGARPFDAKTMPDIRRQVCRAAYVLPEHLSKEGSALLRDILQVDPEKRIYLPNIISHPFFSNHLPSTFLHQNSVTPNPSRIDAPHGYRAPFQTNQAIHHKLRQSSDHGLPASKNRARFALGDIANVDLRSVLRNELASGSGPVFSGPARRIVSDPVPRRRNSASGTKKFPVHARSQSMQAPLDDNAKEGQSEVCLEPSLEMDPGSSEVTRVLREDITPKRMEKRPQNTNGMCNKQHLYSETKTEIAFPKLPIGTARPTPFSTSSMNCQTHKTTYGQIMVLPSRGLLVDFRESQRRKGLKGDEVLVVDADGSKISVYSAPHLSSPCCLIEPMHQFSVDSLPSVYWKQYNDAGRLVDQIQQRTPKLVLYSSVVKCTLMANTPQGDIELLFSNWAPTAGKSSVLYDSHPSMRLRFSRQNHVLEVAQHISGNAGEEWRKKVISTTPEPPYISATDWKTLEQAEKDAIKHLTQFVRTCQTFEMAMDTCKMPSDGIPAIDTDSGNVVPTMRHTSSDRRDPQNASRYPPSIVNSLSSFSLARRPAKLSAARSQGSQENEGDNVELISQDFPSHDTEFSGKVFHSKINSAWQDDDPENMTAGSRDIQTRFIHSVGWCIRYGSCISQGGRYRVMFLDGAALDIDVDEDWAEFKSLSGEVTMLKIQECSSNREVGERMRVFEKFVSLFDDSQNV